MRAGFEDLHVPLQMKTELEKLYLEKLKQATLTFEKDRRNLEKKMEKMKKRFENNLRFLETSKPYSVVRVPCAANDREENQMKTQPTYMSSSYCEMLNNYVIGNTGL